jgi:hypothetical protein
MIMIPAANPLLLSRRTLVAGAALATLLPGCAGAQSMMGAASPAPRRTPDVIYVPTPEAVVARMLELAEPKPGDILFDLGSGDGRIPITAAQKYGITGFGIDIDPQRIREANDNAVKANVTDKVTFKEADLFTSDFSTASIVTLYLLPSLNVKLRPQLFQQLKPGTRISSHAFDMADWAPDHFETVDGAEVFFWVLPANVAGSWAITAPIGAGVGGGFTLSLKQTFQQLDAAATNGVSLEQVSLRGTKLTLVLGNRTTLTATVAGDTLTFDQPGWTATRKTRGEIEGVKPK